MAPENVADSPMLADPTWPTSTCAVSAATVGKSVWAQKALAASPVKSAHAAAGRQAETASRAKALFGTAML
jgi:hypothetical protein